MMHCTGIPWVYTVNYILKEPYAPKLPSDTERHSKDSITDTVGIRDGLICRRMEAVTARVPVPVPYTPYSALPYSHR